jgi:hypothetical protein
MTPAISVCSLSDKFEYLLKESEDYHGVDNSFLYMLQSDCVHKIENETIF